MVHTNGIGCAIAEVLDNQVNDILTWDWSQDDPAPLFPVQLQSVDASHGFSNLIIETSDGSRFRVSIVRI